MTYCISVPILQGISYGVGKRWRPTITFLLFYTESKENKASFVSRVAFTKASPMSQIRKWKCQAFRDG